MIKQHRLVNDLLKDDIKDMHGLQVRSSTIRDHGRLTLTLSLVAAVYRAAQDQGAVIPTTRPSSHSLPPQPCCNTKHFRPFIRSTVHCRPREGAFGHKSGERVPEGAGSSEPSMEDCWLAGSDRP